MRYVLLLAMLLSLVAHGQQPPPPEMTVGIIDFYGMNKVSVEALRGALTVKAGDSIPFGDSTQKDSQKRLEALPGVSRALVNVVCCDGGKVIVYVGVEEPGAPALKLREAPTGAVRLSDAIVNASAQFGEALEVAVRAGRAEEDDSQGHALFQDPGARAIQERFIPFAREDEKNLRQVLRESGKAEHRAIAAQVLGYAADKQSVVEDLVRAMSDPSGGVRNDAMRALVVFTRMTPTATRKVPIVPYEPFVAMLNSLVWTDRNKSSLALMQLTQARDPRLMALLRRDAMNSLVQIARWKSEGHAAPGRVILARLAGYTDEQAAKAAASHDIEAIIAAALNAK